MKYCDRCKTDTDRKKDGECKPCAKIYRSVWTSKNKDRIISRNAAYRVENKENIRLKNIAYREKNKEKSKATAHAWHQANPEKRKINRQNYRVRKRASRGKLSSDLIQRLFKMQRGLCPCCKQPLGNDYHLDHIEALANGGANEDQNMQLLRKTCNLSKGAKDPIDFMQQRGFLL